MVIRCFQVDIRNEKVCLVSFKRFNDNSDQVYPTITLCISNPIMKGKLETLSNGLYNTSSFTKLLQNNYMSGSISEIRYDDVSVDINEYLVNYKVLFSDISGTLTMNNCGGNELSVKSKLFCCYLANNKRL